MMMLESIALSLAIVLGSGVAAMGIASLLLVRPSDRTAAQLRAENEQLQREIAELKRDAARMGPMR